jgi:predicted acylesterase/phospholipase RssA
VLRDLIGDCEIEELQISFTAVATHLDTGQGVWVRSGKLFAPIGVSSAARMIFPPVSHGNRTLLDRAVVDAVPIAPTPDGHRRANCGGPERPHQSPAPHPTALPEVRRRDECDEARRVRASTPESASRSSRPVFHDGFSFCWSAPGYWKGKQQIGNS